MLHRRWLYGRHEMHQIADRYFNPQRVNTVWISLLAAFAIGECRAAGAPPAKTIPESLGFNVHLTGPDREWDGIKAAGVTFVRKDF